MSLSENNSEQNVQTKSNHMPVVYRVMEMLGAGLGAMGLVVARVDTESPAYAGYLITAVGVALAATGVWGVSSDTHDEE